MTGDQQAASIPDNLHKQLDIDFALKAAEIGVWEVDPVTNQVIWDDRCRQLFGLRHDNILPYEQAIRYIHPDDVDSVDAAVQRAMTPSLGGTYDQTYRTIGADDGVLRWVRFRGKAYFSETGVVQRFGGIAQDMTGWMSQMETVAVSSARFRTIMDQAPAAMAVFTGPDHIVDMTNEAHLTLLGRQADEIVGKPLFDAIPELKGQGYEERLADVLTTGQPYRADEQKVTLLRNGQRETVYSNFVYQPFREVDGTVTGVMVVATEVTQQLAQRQQLERTKNLLQAAVDLVELGLWNWDVTTDTVTFDERVRHWYGYEDGISIAQTLAYIHPDDRDRVQAIIQQTTQASSSARLDITQRIVNPKTGIERIIRVLASLDLGDQGQLIQLSGISQDVTQQVQAQQQLEASEAKLRGVIATAPAGIGLFVGRDLIIENPNQTFIDIVGKGAGIVGLPLREAMPELLTEGQSFLAILDDIYTTGVPFITPASLVKIVQNGVLNDNYYNISYTPLRNAAGAIYAILDIAIDVTEQVRSQQALEEKEAALRNTIELAELGTFSVDVATTIITVSPRVADWFGFDTLTVDTASFIDRVRQDDQEHVRNSLANTLLTKSGGCYDVIHSVVHAQTGHQLIIHALGQLHRDADGQPLRIEGTAQDITAQREIQLVLEQQVQQRTEELAASNEELRVINEELTAGNEEYAVINEELEEANSLLSRSNDNLEQFAYIASHDLQEPLRKIQQFGDLLKLRLADSVGREELMFLERMQVAASRMSVLIKDLLSFSRISTQRNVEGPVPLQEVVALVLDTMDLTITETKAQLQVDTLPTVSGDAVQLGQLFQNLISNALKFQRTDQSGALIPPRVHIGAQLLTVDQLPDKVKPLRRMAAYHRIEVTDNGIGFDEKYLDRIFQVFQRLHGKSNYTGTGVGLAICEKVVTNHGGFITATSQPDQGAAFIIYLPADC